ncbi:arginyl-tRNA--protein transferase 2-like isoform X2 [Tasmannia lanceolata]
MERTCCPSYTIRLKADDFVPSKEQVRVSKRMQKFLDGTLNAQNLDQFKDNPNSAKALDSSLSNASSSVMVSESVRKESSSGNCEEKHQSEQYMHYLSNKIDNAVSACIEKGEFPSDIKFPKAIVKKVAPQVKKKLTEISGDLLYTSSVPFQIAAALKRSLSAEKTSLQLGLLRNVETQNWQSLELSPKAVAEKLACSLDQQGELSNLSTKASNGHLNFFLNSNQIGSNEVHVSVNASAVSTEGSGANANHGCLLNSSECPHKRRKLEIRLKRSSFDPEEYELYKRYQIRVHNDKPDQVKESSYKRFLVDTPIIFVPPSGDGTVPPCGFGSFHQQYVIDGQLVAVGVVDILPKCLSSKYLFWDPDLAFLSLGKYSALREIGWVKETQVHCSSLQYYYLGYYIQSCSKMRYKASYRPSELLCPLRYQWVPFDIARPLLDKKPYTILSDFATVQIGTSSPSDVPENSTEQQYIDLDQEDQIEDFSDEDEEMEIDFESSERTPGYDSGPETSTIASVDELKAVDVSNIVLDLNGARVKLKDLQRVFNLIEKRHIDLLELQLQRYKKVVGAGLSDRMIYSL